MEERFCRQEALLGGPAMERLRRSTVAVLGLGGVGSWCAEALARSGVGGLVLVDGDTVSRSNINRQLCALESTIGLAKAEVMAGRVRDIAPGCRVRGRVLRYGPETREAFFDQPYDYIVDAVDLVSCKVDLIVEAAARGVPVVSALGTGNKRDAQLLRLGDIGQTSGCPLARVVRRELRRRGITHLPVVFSPEPPAEAGQTEAPPPGRRSVPGSLVWVPAAAGLLLAQHVVEALCGPDGREAAP